MEKNANYSILLTLLATVIYIGLVRVQNLTYKTVYMTYLPMVPEGKHLVKKNAPFTFLFIYFNSLNHYDAKTKQNTVLIDNLIFANGVQLADDESFVLVNDLNRNRILRYYLKGSKKGTYDTFIDGLPGMPDNLNSDGKGGFLVPLVVAVDQDHPCVPQMLSQFPLLRRLIVRVFGLLELGFSFVDRVYPNEIAERAVHFVRIAMSQHFEFNLFFFFLRLVILHRPDLLLQNVLQCYVFLKTVKLWIVFTPPAETFLALQKHLFTKILYI